MSPKTPSTITERPPVVVIMGHIDHGKSTLLDYIRKTNIVAKEAGGITQHLGAYEVIHTTAEGKKGSITFLDTPGHEAFTAIRERGAQVADIAILVVSAEDGVKPQTLEALRCIRDAKLPFIVAINKIDKPGADIERAKQALAEHEVYVEGYGGDVPWVAISALKGTGIPELLDTIILVADLASLTSNGSAAPIGTVIEAHRDSKKGISATLIIKDGTLESGQCVVAEDAHSPVRIFEDFQGKNIKSATASRAVRVIGWDKIPPVGAVFSTCDTKSEGEKLARVNFLEKAEAKAVKARSSQNSSTDQGEKIIIPIILKADVIGSMDGIKQELTKIKHDKVAIKLVADSIGDINENDIKGALSVPGTILIAFNTKVDPKAQSMLERNPINFQSFDVIYKLLEYVSATLTSKIPKEYVSETLGRAKILMIFSKNKDKQILGGKVQEGAITLGSEVKILRRDVEIGLGKIKELQQQKVKAQEVREGYEFGALIESKIEITQGDKVECFHIVEK